MRNAILSFPLSIVVLLAAAQAQVAQTPQGSHKAKPATQKQPTLEESYQFIEDHLNTPGTLSMTVDYSLANGPHGSMTVDYGIDGAAVSGCVMQYVTQTNVMKADTIANNENLAIENNDEFKAYTQAMALGDGDEKIEALRKFTQTYPKSAATKNVLDELMRAYFSNNDRSAIDIATALLKMNSLNLAALYITDHTPSCAADEPGYLVHLINCVTRINLTDVQDVQLQPFGEYIKQRRNALGLQSVTGTLTQPEITALTIEMKSGQKAVIPVSDATLADQMQHMITRSVELCGKMKK